MEDNKHINVIDWFMNKIAELECGLNELKARHLELEKELDNAKNIKN